MTSVSVVTGANSGIGRAISLHLASQGHTVFGTVRDVRKASKLEAMAADMGTSVRLVELDIADDDSVRRGFDAILEQTDGVVDVLVNNAGVGLFAPVAEMSVEDWHAVIETNVNGVFYCTREAIPRMKQRGGGYIFNVSSLAGRNAFPNASAYCASKHAVNGFSEVLFQEVREDDIRVTYLMPGSVATAFGRGTAAKQDWALQPEDVGEIVVDLLRSHPRAMSSRVEMRPSRPKKG